MQSASNMYDNQKSGSALLLCLPIRHSVIFWNDLFVVTGNFKVRPFNNPASDCAQTMPPEVYTLGLTKSFYCHYSCTVLLLFFSFIQQEAYKNVDKITVVHHL